MQWRMVAMLLVALAGILSARADCAETLSVITGKSVGPLRLGMTRAEAGHLISSGANDGYGNPPYSEVGWTSNVFWSNTRMSVGTLRMICKNDRVVQIEISTHDVRLPRSDAEIAVAYPGEDKREQAAIKKRLAKLIVVTVADMTTPFKVLRQVHPGMRLDEFSDNDNPQLSHSYYYADDVKNGITFTYLAENTKDQPKIKVRDLRPDDVPERIIIHQPGTRVLAIYEGQENKPVNPSPFLGRLRDWFTNSSNRG